MGYDLNRALEWGEMARSQIQKRLGLKDRFHFRNAYLIPALEERIIQDNSF